MASAESATAGSQGASSAETTGGSTAARTADTDTSQSQSLTIEHRRRTERWTGLVGIAFLLGGIGLLTTQPALLLASAACIGILGFIAASSQPTPQLSVRREFGDEDLAPGDNVAVQVVVKNTGDGTLPDLRLVDLVPDGLAVVDGSPRSGAILRPGEQVTLTYTVAVRRGRQVFDGMTVLVRGMAGTVETKYSVAAVDELIVEPEFEPLEQPPVRSLTTPYTGRVQTDEAGEGVEFHTLREYRPGDPVRRVDWNRRARGEALATLEFRTERTASVVLVADRRTQAFVRPKDAEPTAADKGVDAICRLLPTLLNHGDRVGIAAVGPTFHWLAPSTGTTHRARARSLLATNPAFAPRAPEQARPVGLAIRRLRKSLSGHDQALICTPLCDDEIVRAIRRLHAHGHRTTVISADPTVRRTDGQRLARVERTLRIAKLRRAGVRVVDWGYDESLEMALARSAERWSA